MNKTHIWKADYEHAKKVWNTVNIKTLREYQDLYVQSDTLQLADVFENFRNTCMNIYIYELDPCYVVSEPGLAWEALLKKTTTIRIIN